MLTGTYTYLGHRYEVSAYDFGDAIPAYLVPYTNADRRFLDKGVRILDESGEVDEVIPAGWEQLYVSVGVGYTKVCSELIKEGNSKYKSDLNGDALSMFGSIIRGMKSACNRTNRDNEYGLYAEAFSPQSDIKYNVSGGDIILRMKVILALNYTNGREGDEEISLTLGDDGSYNVKIEKSSSYQQQFKMNLGEWVNVRGEDDWDFGGENTIFSLSEIIERNPEKSYVWLLNRRYEIVKGIKRVEELCQMIWKHKGLVAFDTETTGLRVNITSRQGIGDRLVGMVFSIKPGEAYYFPVAHKKIPNICSPENETAIIEKYFKPILETKEILCHNGSFDWKVMYNYGIFCNIKHDTLILFKVTVWNDHRNLSLGLKDLTRTFLDRDSFELSDFVNGKFGKGNVKFWDFDEESTKYYACPDTDNLIELHQYCEDQGLLAKYGAKKLYEIEVAFSLCIAYQEYYGHCVDVSRIDDLVRGIIETKNEEYKAMVDLVGHDFNPRSNPELSRVVFQELGYPVLEKTATGNPKLDKDVRKKLMDEKNPDGSRKYPFIKHLHEYLGVAQLESNFTKGLDKFATEDGLIFSEVQQFLETGRVSVKDPNYQSYNDTVKKYIIPRAGFYMMDADYSSVEARIMVSMAGCRGMVEKLKDPDTDYHTQKASDMFGVPYELVTHKLRKMSKGVNFGILYGLGDPNLGVNLYGSKSPENTRKAKHQKELYFKGMEELKKFIEDSKAQGTSQLYSTTYFGRRRYFDPRKERKDRIERQSCNARIQGTAADIYKIAMVRLLHTIRKNGWLGKVLISAFVHDECVLEVSKSIDPMVMLKNLRKCMMLEINGWCPLFIGCGFGTNWYEAKNIEIPVQVQEQLTRDYGESGVEWWNGDGAGLRDFVVKTIDEYGRDRVMGYLKDPSNKGKVLSPAINTLAHNVVESILGGADIEGCVCKNIKKCDDMIENLQEFCKAFNCMDLFTEAEVKSAVHVEHTQEESTVGDSSEEWHSEEDDLMSALFARLKVTGVVYDQGQEDRRIYISYLNDANFMSIIGRTLAQNPGKSPVFAVKDEEVYSVNASVSPSVYPTLLKLYMQYFRLHPNHN